MVGGRPTRKLAAVPIKIAAPRAKMPIILLNPKAYDSPGTGTLEEQCHGSQKTPRVAVTIATIQSPNATFL
jgi:hypothetical protein